MERAANTKDKLSRRLSSLKVVIDLLNHELDLAKAEKGVTLERPRIEAMITSLEVFVEDVEDTLKGGRRGEDKMERATARANG